jgi:hypothetical protein
MVTGMKYLFLFILCFLSWGIIQSAQHLSILIHRQCDIPALPVRSSDRNFRYMLDGIRQTHHHDRLAMLRDFDCQRLIEDHCAGRYGPGFFNVELCIRWHYVKEFLGLLDLTPQERNKQQ